ncbi:MAG: hypothetical protein AB8G96_14095 [Phycisphaerales bacterium]
MPTPSSAAGRSTARTRSRASGSSASASAAAKRSARSSKKATAPKKVTRKKTARTKTVAAAKTVSPRKKTTRAKTAATPKAAAKKVSPRKKTTRAKTAATPKAAAKKVSPRKKTTRAKTAATPKAAAKKVSPRKKTARAKTAATPKAAAKKASPRKKTTRATTARAKIAATPKAATKKVSPRTKTTRGSATATPKARTIAAAAAAATSTAAPTASTAPSPNAAPATPVAAPSAPATTTALARRPSSAPGAPALAGSGPRPLAAAAASSFADLEHARDAWDDLVNRAGAGPLAEFDVARARSRAEVPADEGPIRRREILVVPDGDRLRAAMPMTVERVRAPFAPMRMVSVTGGRPTSFGGRLPSPALVDPDRAADAWRAILFHAAEELKADVIEISGLPEDSPAWNGLHAMFDGSGDAAVPAQVMRERSQGTWGSLTINARGRGEWSDQTDASFKAIDDSRGPVERRVSIDPSEVLTDVHEIDRLLDGRDAAPLATAAGGPEALRSLVRAAPAALSVNLRVGRLTISRAAALVSGDRAALLAVGRVGGRDWDGCEVDRLAIAALLEELGRRGVRQVSTGSEGLWFHGQAHTGEPAPMRSMLLCPAGSAARERARLFENVADTLGRLPALGPFERLVQRMRPWAGVAPANAVRLAA